MGVSKNIILTNFEKEVIKNDFTFVNKETGQVVGLNEASFYSMNIISKENGIRVKFLSVKGLYKGEAYVTLVVTGDSQAWIQVEYKLPEGTEPELSAEGFPTNKKIISSKEGLTKIFSNLKQGGASKETVDSELDFLG